ncbi:related to NmrA-like family protein [Colletotrichum tofieldiae]|nr:related to NmrA-like family protein [Colletotrichum tofieldiae]GKT71790.1 related to NmrA-like family protein [Colletotrichum tofieldiae]
MSIKNIAFVGASGNLGQLVLPELLKTDLNLTAVTRKTSSAKFPEGIKVAKIDFSLSSLTNGFKEQDAVVSMLPILALGDQDIIIEPTIAADNEAVTAAIPFLEAKTKYLEHLKAKEGVISWTALFTGPFFDSISRSLVAVLSHAPETANQLVYVESFTTTQFEVLAAIKKTTGEKWKVVTKKSEDIRAGGLKAMGKGNIMEGGANVILAYVLGKDALEDHSQVEVGIWNDRLALPKQTVEGEVKRVLQDVLVNL